MTRIETAIAIDCIHVGYLITADLLSEAGEDLTSHVLDMAVATRKHLLDALTRIVTSHVVYEATKSPSKETLKRLPIPPPLLSTNLLHLSI